MVRSIDPTQLDRLNNILDPSVVNSAMPDRRRRLKLAPPAPAATPAPVNLSTLDGMLAPDVANTAMPGRASATAALPASGSFNRPSPVDVRATPRDIRAMSWLDQLHQKLGQTNAAAAVRQDANQTAMQTPTGRIGLLQNNFDAADYLDPANRFNVQSGAASAIQGERVLQGDMNRLDTVNRIGAGRTLSGWDYTPAERQQLQRAGATLSYLAPPGANPSAETPGQTADRVLRNDFSGETVNGKYVPVNPITHMQGEWRTNPVTHKSEWSAYSDILSPAAYAQRTANQASAGVGSQAVADRAAAAANEGLTVAQLGRQDYQDKVRRETLTAQQGAQQAQRDHEVLLATIKSMPGGEDRRQAARAAATDLNSYQSEVQSYMQDIARLEKQMSEDTTYKVGGLETATPSQVAYRKRMDAQLAAAYKGRDDARAAMAESRSRLRTLGVPLADGGGGNVFAQATQFAEDGQGNRIGLVNGVWVDQQGNPVR